MTALAGTGGLARFHLRHDRIRLAVWIASILLLVVVTVSSTKAVYPTQADLDQAAAVAVDNPAALAFNGPAQALDTIGGQVAFQLGAFGLTMVGLMALLLVSRLTRAEEDSGRVELIRSMPVGRHAPLAAALLVVSGVVVVLSGLITVALVAYDLPAAGSVALGASFAAVGLIFVAVTGVTAQVTENPRVASGAAGAVLGAAFVVRAVGDIGDGTVSWFSPIGLVQKSRPYAGERWWVLLLAVVLVAALVVVAARLAGRRDFGAGLVAPRPGPAVARPSLGTPLGLALRLQRGTIGWWALAVLLTGAAYGSIADSIEDFVTDNEAMRDLMARAGGADLVDSYLSTTFLTLAIIAGGFTLQAALRLRTEETALRAEPVLATPIPRWRWLGSHLVVVVVGSAVVLLAGGLGTGVAHAVVVGDAGQVTRLLGAAIVYVPAVWVLGGIAVALFALAPQWAVASWAVLAACFVIGMFGTLFELPGWVMNLSPFEHTPLLPASSMRVLPVVLLTAVAAALTGAGVAGFRRRDITA